MKSIDGGSVRSSWSSAGGGVEASPPIIVRAASYGTPFTSSASDRS
ncbi:MAG: hypothetical protein QM775_34525 [Pirellulales bacterium]